MARLAWVSSDLLHSLCILKSSWGCINLITCHSWQSRAAADALLPRPLGILLEEREARCVCLHCSCSFLPPRPAAGSLSGLVVPGESGRAFLSRELLWGTRDERGLSNTAAACRPQGPWVTHWDVSFCIQLDRVRRELEAICAGFDGRQVNWVLCKASRMQWVFLRVTGLLPWLLIYICFLHPNKYFQIGYTSDNPPEAQSLQSWKFTSPFSVPRYKQIITLLIFGGAAQKSNIRKFPNTKIIWNPLNS